jgi:phosphoribosylaminoimidazole carboxylase (NCAIR synthetase)
MTENVSSQLQDNRYYCVTVMSALEYVGVLAIEFLEKDGRYWQ